MAGSDIEGQPGVTLPKDDGTSEVTIPEDTTSGAVIFTVQPTGATWTYTLTPSTSPFSINIGGSVTLSGPVDYESAIKSYTLSIQVTDAGGHTDRILTVFISNVYDVSPTLTPPSPIPTIEEELVVGTTVATFTVTDSETVDGDTLYFSLLGADTKYLQIDATTGTLTIRDRIDYDFGLTSLDVTVQVSDSGGNTASQAVTFTVNDINDNSPICSPGSVVVTVPEGTGGGTTVGTVSCTDADSPPNSDLTYTIFTGDDATVKFDIAANVISTSTTPLDYETKSDYTLVVHAVDSPASGTPRTGTVAFYIKVSPVNDFDPVWGTNVPAGKTFSVLESSPLGTSIVTIVATDDDLGTDGVLTYQLVSVTTDAGITVAGVLALGTSTGKLTTITTLDRESVTSYTVVVRATDGGAPARSVDDTLTITVTDVNDNAPVFTAASVLTGSIPEDSAVATPILTLVASDADATSTLTFSVTGGDVGPPKFEFSGTTLGQLQLASPIDLDQPTNDAGYYTLTVIVTDGGTPELTGTTYVPVTVTAVNQHTPVMNTPSPASTVVVTENSNVGTSIAKITATDNDYGTDGIVSYSITMSYLKLSDGNTGPAFVIDSATGEIRTMSALDFETTKLYNLEVTATDGVRSVSSIVTVSITDINEDAPTCTDYYIQQAMPEDDTVPKAVTSLISCSDPNADTLTYTISSGNPPGLFLINSATGELSVSKVFDYETTTGYLLTVTVTDSGTPPLTVDVAVRILVTPVNEVPPIFTQTTYTVATSESAPIGDRVVQVTATDADVGALDGTVRYIITDGDSQGRFTIRESTGSITIAKPLDRESLDTYNLTVIAVDDAPGSVTERTATAFVFVTVTDANDNSPVFTPSTYVGLVSEDASPLAVILTVTTTDDDLAGNVNSRIQYSVISRATGNVFEFSNADLRLAAGKSLNYATSSSYDLVIQAADKGNPVLTTTARVTVNVQPANQNNPIFTDPNQSISVDESVAVGTKILTATAIDADSAIFGSVAYTIISGNVPANSFVINDVTGDILVWSKLDADVAPGFFNLTLEATDGGGKSATTWLHIALNDVNDNYPQFTRNIYNVAVDEDLSIGTSVARIVATDADSGTNAQMVYSITSGDGQTTFAIDATTGEITTVSALDYEIKRIFSLVVMATDSGTPTPKSATTMVVISLNDLNDNSPTFTPSTLTVEVTENVAIGTPVIKMVASDADSDANSNNKFVYILISSLFSIDPNTGTITTKGLIDREKTALQVLTVTARDQNGVGRIGTATLTVNIVDENDNSPIVTGTYSKTVPEDTKVGTIIDTVTATDADSGHNGEMTFKITNGDPNSDFTLDITSGILQLRKVLNREVRPSYALEITVTDNGVTPKDDVVIVSITVGDVNDNDPVFQNLLYNFSIAENVPLGSTLDYVTALDADMGVNGDVEYAFLIYWQGKTSDFTVDSVTGEITTAGGLDRETMDTYQIWLRASDKGTPSRYRNTNVTIVVTDLNDNDPHFDALSYSAKIREDLAVGTAILPVMVTDNDIGVNSDITLSIDTSTPEGTTADLVFATNSVTGMVSLKTSVYQNADRTYIFKVLAVDGGATPRTATATVTVNVEDVNNNPPVMSPRFYNTEVAYNGVCDSSITTVTATDADSGLNGQIKYFLSQSTYSYLFSIDGSSGDVSLASQASNNFRYVIEALAKDAGSPVLTATTSATIRIDTFDPNVVAVTFKLNIDRTTFQAEKATFISELQTLIRATYPSAVFRVWCVESVGTTQVSGRRKLLQAFSPVTVHGYTVADSSTDSVSNVTQDKTLLTSSETLKFLSTDPLGTPISALNEGGLAGLSIQSVRRYYDPVTPWAQTLEGIIILTVIAVVILVLICTVVVSSLYGCRKKKRPVSPQPRRVGTPQSITVVTPQSNIPDILYMDTPPVYTEYDAPVKSPRNLFKKRKFRSLAILNREFEGKAVDPASGKVYGYDTRTNERKWLTTSEGGSVRVTHH
ncbi:protocadherin Fat 4-like [Haliotis cracherodii]|uniref:protocadherin Fat 4-like n=1 Tax=Haliotis cracherodii TaxID=6455 RepID=UPI0039EAD5E8